MGTILSQEDIASYQAQVEQRLDQMEKLTADLVAIAERLEDEMRIVRTSPPAPECRVCPIWISTRITSLLDAASG